MLTIQDGDEEPSLHGCVVLDPTGVVVACDGAARELLVGIVEEPIGSVWQGVPAGSNVETSWSRCTAGDGSWIVVLLWRGGTQRRVQEEIAERIHDEPLQRLMSAKWRVADAVAEIEACWEALREVTAQLRTPALTSDEAWCTAVSGEDVRVQACAEGVGELREKELALATRTVREAVRNAVRHSGARRITAVLRVRDGVIVGEVSDDGCGVEPERIAVAITNGSLGVLTMREGVRAAGGVLEVRGGEDGGTVVRFAFPARNTPGAENGQSAQQRHSGAGDGAERQTYREQPARG